MSEKQIYTMAHAEARRRAISAVTLAKDGYVVTIRPSTRNLETNAKLHALLTEISETREWAGERRSVTVWKRLLVASFLRARGEPLEVLPALDGSGVDVIYEHTSQMSQKVCGELIEFIEAWAEVGEVATA